jgi:hypothetical protein
MVVGFMRSIITLTYYPDDRLRVFHCPTPRGAVIAALVLGGLEVLQEQAALLAGGVFGFDGVFGLEVD